MQLETADRELVRIVDAALAEAARRSAGWLVCRPGCTQCCYGPFSITELDARRLQRGLAELETRDPSRAMRVRERARKATVLGEDDPCPALDVTTGLCDLYQARPITCRTFGPPVRCGSDAVGVCELCYQGASEEDIAECEVEIDPDSLESALLEQLGAARETTVSLALADYHKAGLLAVRGDRMLLCRKKDTTSLLILPGGCLEPGESAVECLRRELREELGEVRVDGLEYVGAYTDRAAGSDGKMVHIELYRGELIGEPAAHAEIRELIWFGPSDARAQLAPSLGNKILPDLLARGLLPWDKR